jgi:hypothetical protein
MADLIIKLAKGILKGPWDEGGNHGKKPETITILRFPIERRKVVYYEPIAL